MIVNKKELSDIVGVAERSLTTWQKNGLPIEIDGGRGAANQYDTKSVIQWMILREIGKLTVNTDGISHDYDEERARLTHHQANKTSLEEDVLRGKLIPAETVETVWGDMVSAFRAKILSLPTKTAHMMLAVEKLSDAEDILKDVVFEALTELSEYEHSRYGIEINPSSDKETSSTAETDG